MSLNVSTFEGNIDLSTIPANRTWNFSPVAPFPDYILGVNKNVAIKKIEVGVTYNSLSPNDDIIVEDWNCNLILINRDQEIYSTIRGSVSSITSGVFTSLIALTQVSIEFSKKMPIIDFNDDFILAGGLRQNFFSLKFSNTTTLLTDLVRYYINVYWEELCN